jgi:Tfp pilus assembly protein PilV
MGFLRKITGVQGQINAANRNAEAQEQAIAQAEQQTVQTMQANAKAVADQQAQFAARQAAEAAATAAVSLPMEQAEVKLDEAGATSTSRKARRRKFGQSVSGVSI